MSNEFNGLRSKLVSFEKFQMWHILAQTLEVLSFTLVLSKEKKKRK